MEVCFICGKTVRDDVDYARIIKEGAIRKVSNIVLPGQEPRRLCKEHLRLALFAHEMQEQDFTLCPLDEED